MPLDPHAAFDPYNGAEGLLVRVAILPVHPGSKRPNVEINDTKDVYELAEHLAWADREHMVVIALDNGNRVLAINEGAIGNVNNVSQSWHLLTRVPNMVGATRVILVHNHPAGRRVARVLRSLRRPTRRWRRTQSVRSARWGSRSWTWSWLRRTRIRRRYRKIERSVRGNRSGNAHSRRPFDAAEFLAPDDRRCAARFEVLSGRATLLVCYGSVEGKDLNEHAKSSLMRKVSEEPTLASKINLVPVANLAAANNPMFRPAVLMMVRRLREIWASRSGSIGRECWRVSSDGRRRRCS